MSQVNSFSSSLRVATEASTIICTKDTRLSCTRNRRESYPVNTNKLATSVEQSLESLSLESTRFRGGSFCFEIIDAREILVAEPESFFSSTEARFIRRYIFFGWADVGREKICRKETVYQLISQKPTVCLRSGR